MYFSLLNDSQMIGRPIQNAMTDAKRTKMIPIQNIALGSSYPMIGSVSGPERFHRIAAKETIDTTASTAPNSRVFFE